MPVYDISKLYTTSISILGNGADEMKKTVT